jgi:hypothetical protein
MNRGDPSVINEHDTDLGVLNPLSGEGSANQPLKPGRGNTERSLPVVHVDDDSRPGRLGGDAAAESRH